MIGNANFELQDDLEVGVDPKTYVDQLNPAPPLPGNYTFKVLKAAWKLKPNTNEVLMVDGRFPVFTLQQVEIVDPELFNQKVNLYQDFGTKPFASGARQGSSPFGDLTRAFNVDQGWQGLEQGRELIQEYVETNQVFRATGNWVARDFEWVKEQIDELRLPPANLRTNEERKQVNDLYRAAELKGMKKFPSATRADGTTYYVHLWKGVDGGKNLEARFELTKLFNSDASVALGPFNN